MKITLEHLGKTVRYRDSNSFTIEGFEAEDNRLYAYGTGDFWGSRPTNPRYPYKPYCILNGLDADDFSLVIPEERLPASIESLMKEFGCHEKQTRALVAAILKEVKEK